MSGFSGVDLQILEDAFGCAVAAGHGAFDGGRKAGVGPVTGQEEDRQVGAGGRMGVAGGEGKGGVALPDDAVVPEAGPFGAGHKCAEVFQSDGDKLIVGAMDEGVGGAGDQDDVTCRGPVAVFVEGRFVEGPVQARSQHADEFGLDDGAVEPEVDGEDGGGTECREVVSEMGEGIGEHPREGGWGDGTDAGVRSEAFARPELDGDAAWRALHGGGGRPEAHTASPVFDGAVSGVGIKGAEAHIGIAEAAAFRTVEEGFAQDRHQVAGGGRGRGLVQGGGAEGVPERLADAGGLPTSIEPGVYRQVGLLRRFHGIGDAAEPEGISESDTAKSEQPDEQMERRRKQAGKGEGGLSCVGMAKVDAEMVLKVEAVGRADPGQKIPGVVEALHQEVLAVVYGVSRGLVRKGVGPASEVSAPFNEENVDVPCREGHRGREPGKAASDDGYAAHGADRWGRLGSQMVSAIQSFLKLLKRMA